MAKTYKYLAQCEDFKKLRKHYSKKQLREFEQIIAEFEEYKKTRKSDERYATYNEVYIIFWYVGIISTERLFRNIKAK